MNASGARPATLYVGTIVLVLLAVEAVSGLLLLLAYDGSVDGAYASVRHLSTAVPLGWLLRSVHAWCAHLLILCALAHLVWVFAHGAYRGRGVGPWLWMSGLAILALLEGMAISGGLLPWSRTACAEAWAISRMLAAVPLVGSALAELARGGPAVSEPTLARFFGCHVAVLPMLLAGCGGLHLWLVQWQRAGRPQRSRLVEPRVAALAMVGVALLCVLHPWPLGEPAAARVTEGLVPPWFLRPVWAVLQRLPGAAGVAALGLAGAWIAALPLVDRGRFARWIAAVLLVVVLLLTAVPPG